MFCKALRYSTTIKTVITMIESQVYIVYRVPHCDRYYCPPPPKAVLEVQEALPPGRGDGSPPIGANLSYFQGTPLKAFPGLCAPALSRCTPRRSAFGKRRVSELESRYARFLCSSALPIGRALLHRSVRKRTFAVFVSATGGKRLRSLWNPSSDASHRGSLLLKNKTLRRRR